MKLTLAEPRFLKESISVISDIVTEATLKVSSQGIELIAMDPANVAMVVFKLLSSSFVTCEIKEPTNLTINLNNLKQVLRRIKSNDSLTLELDENKLKITLQSSSKRTFYLPLIDLDEKEQKIPDLKFPITITTQASILSDAIEDVDIVGESVAFSIEKGVFSISSKGDLSKANVEIPSDEKTKIISEDNAKSKYSIEYLKRMMQGSKLSDTVIIKFNKDYPLKLEYSVLNKIQLLFILAPRVDKD